LEVGLRPLPTSAVLEAYRRSERGKKREQH